MKGTPIFSMKDNCSCFCQKYTNNYLFFNCVLSII